MKIAQEVLLINRGSFEESQEWAVIQNEIRNAIELIVYPPGALNFTINPTSHGNGVKQEQKCLYGSSSRKFWMAT